MPSTTVAAPAKTMTRIKPVVPPKGGSAKRTVCRTCGSPDLHLFLDLGVTPMANAFLTEDDLRKPEPKFPLSAHYCGNCGLVQVLDVVDPSLLFSHYTYFSSASKPMVDHFAEVAADLHKTYLTDPGDLILEIGSNDGIMLKNLVGKSRLVGIDPADNIADIAAKNGVTTIPRFFNPHNASMIRELFGGAKVVFAANCFAHIDDIDGIMEGVTKVLDDDGVFVFENHRFTDMVKSKCFDQIYHEHLCFYTLRPIEHLMDRFGMRVIDARTIPTHGESFQIHAARKGSSYAEKPSVAKVRAEEAGMGLNDPKTYTKLAKEVDELCKAMVKMLKDFKAQGKRIIGYGAPGKGNTLLNYCGIDGSILEYVVDTTPIKQGRYTPGTHIPIRSPEVLKTDTPDYCLLLSWNYADAILKKEEPLRKRGVKFILPVPRLEVV
ncbi:MAG TPA: class I SAM-dependent methyltransferase [Phycisphaerales bacterium]|nr:class I SAM-dependent methyltransferase [Phycisphaerales bacterium]